MSPIFLGGPLSNADYLQKHGWRLSLRFDSTIYHRTEYRQYWTIKNDKTVFLGSVKYHSEWVSLSRHIREMEIETDIWSVHFMLALPIFTTDHFIGKNIDFDWTYCPLGMLYSGSYPDRDFYVQLKHNVFISLPSHANNITRFTLMRSFSMWESNTIVQSGYRLKE